MNSTISNNRATSKVTLTGLMALGPIILLGLGMAAMFMTGRGLYGLAVLAAALGGLLVLFPRITFYLFIASLSFWVPQRLTATFAVHPFDLLMGILILGATLDFLLRPSRERTDVTFDIFFLALVAATLLSGILAHNPAYSVVPILRIAIIYLAFRVMFKFGRELGVRRVLMFYLLVVTALSVYNVATFVAYSGRIRAFGPALLGYESMSMTALPMALAFGLWAPDKRGRRLFLAAAVAIGLGIIATQARGPLLTVLIAVPVLLVFSWRKARREQDRRTRRTVVQIVTVLVILFVLTVALSGTLLAGSWERYTEFVASLEDPQGTVALRLVLWEMAWQTFLDNPIIGIGIGNFRIVHEVYTEFRLFENARFVKTMSAHNVVLHYLAETGLIGTLALVGLALAGLRRAYRIARPKLSSLEAQTAGALFIGMFVFALTLLYMRAWTWGQGGYVLAMLFGLLAASISRFDSNLMDPNRR